MKVSQLTQIAVQVSTIALLLGSLTACGGGSGSGSSSGTKSIAVTQIVEHPSLNAVRDGIKEELAKEGFEADKTLKWQWESAQGNQSTAVQIAKKFVGDNPDAIVAISTPSAQAVAASTQQIPVVFAAVTDPIAAKLVPNWQAPGGMITGVSDAIPVGSHLDIIKAITPKVNKLGVIYNAGEANSASLVNQLKQEASSRKITIAESTVSNTNDVANAAKGLVGKVDAIYIPTDNTVVSALEAVLEVGATHKLPVYAGDTDSVEKGAIATLGFNYQEVGRMTGRVVARILRGANPSTIAVETPNTLELVVNPKGAEKMGVKVPEQVLSKAAKVMQ
ncbi:MAG: ABC transporter substrate-binding protein [Synechococcales bacterium]|nr:ABC transporter substrate-binding protein [Synechococcales bacterium]